MGGLRQSPVMNYKPCLPLAALAAALLLPAPAPAAAGAATITRTNYHGWPDCLVLNNGAATAVVVPAVGRVMQFGFAGEEGVFWENRALAGRLFTGEEKEWTNLGGDKTWPSPEEQWGKFTGRQDWWPPRAFDGLPHEARIENGAVLLISPEDPHYGIRVTRRIRLDPAEPVMSIATTYQRARGAPAKIGVWVITQLKDPVAVFAPLLPETKSPEGYALLSKSRPPSAAVVTPAPGRRMLTMKRDPKSAYKIGCAADTLIWVGRRHALRIDSPRMPGAEHPDQDSNAEIYTNPNPLEYVELEMLGPLFELGPGDEMARVNVYTLYRVTETDPAKTAARIMGW